MINLSLKEFFAIEDQLEEEMVLTKRYLDYADSCTDENLKEKCMNIALVHQKHYNTLLGYLK